MDKYKKLINNSLIFTIGSLGSKLISFIMVPVYTHLLSTIEYGTIDLINTTVNLLLPLLSLELGQAALRFVIDKKSELNKNIIFSNINLYLFVLTGLVILIAPILYLFKLYENYLVLFLLLLLLRISNNIYAQYTRGLGYIKNFAINGILSTFTLVVSNIVLLVFLNYKVEGYLLSMIISLIISNLYLLYSFNAIERIKSFQINFKTFKEMVKFSIPLIPNSGMWWIINGSTRYFIMYFIGAAGNGLYAVANKIPAVISLVTGIFTQAWQLSSFEEYENEGKDEFFSKTFNIYWSFLFIASSAILVVLKPILSRVVQNSYYMSWQIVPFLIFAVIYQSFSSFLGTSYSASKQTKGSFSTSIYAGIISVISSTILIPSIGLVGSGLSSALSFLAMFYIRYKDTQDYARIKIRKLPFLLSNCIFILQSIFLFFADNTFLIIVEIILFSSLLMVNKSVILLSLDKIKNYLLFKY